MSGHRASDEFFALTGASKRNGSRARRTSRHSPINPGSGSTAYINGGRPNSSCSIWIRARARSTASRKGARTTAISAAPATTRVRVQPAR